MDLHLHLQLPLSYWDVLPVPKIMSPTERLELVIRVRLPAALAKLLGFDTEPVRYIVPESPLVAEVRALLESGEAQVSLCDEGVGGTYYIKTSDGTPVAIFKPKDEEPGATNNPKKIVQNPILPPGGGSAREIAAYILDKDHFVGVPETCMLSNVRHECFSTNEAKCGSLQRFVPNDGESSSLGSSMWSVDNIHRIGVLDVRIFNLDRNGENMLVQRREGHDKHFLIPIDHTYCLPPITSLDNAYFEWQFWPQAKKTIFAGNRGLRTVYRY